MNIRRSVAIFRSSLFYLSLSLAILFYGIIFYAFSWHKRWKWRIAYTWAHSFPFLVSLCCGVRYKYEGLENLPNTGHYVIASKHQSVIETFLYVLNFDARTIFKEELLKIPIFGKGLLNIGQIMIKREKGTQAVKVIKDAISEALAASTRPIVIYPQGTRVGLTDRTTSYKTGFYLLYHDFDLPLIPAALDTAKVWPARTFVIYPGTVTIRFLPPMAKGLGKRDATIELEHLIEAGCDQLGRS